MSLTDVLVLLITVAIVATAVVSYVRTRPEKLESNMPHVGGPGIGVDDLRRRSNELANDGSGDSIDFGGGDFGGGDGGGGGGDG